MARGGRSVGRVADVNIERFTKRSRRQEAGVRGNWKRRLCSVAWISLVKRGTKLRAENPQKQVAVVIATERLSPSSEEAAASPASFSKPRKLSPGRGARGSESHSCFPVGSTLV